MTLIKIAAEIRKDVAQILKIASLNLAYLPENQAAEPIWWDNQLVLQKLHISASTLKRRRKQGIIPFTRSGNKLYYKPSDIEEVLARKLA